jgi:hypothetical protein
LVNRSLDLSKKPKKDYFQCIIWEWIMPFVSSHWRVLKNDDPHYLVLHATSMTKFYIMVYYF